MSAPIGVAIIGGGIFVKEHHIPAVLECGILSLKAIFSRSLQSAEATASLIPASSPAPELYAEDAGPGRALTDLLARADITGVIIALPIPAQPAYIRAALAAGKHVLAEKPIAKDVATAQQLIADGAGLATGGATLSIAENQRFFPRWTFALAEAAKIRGALGRVTHFSVRVSNATPRDNKYYNTAWRKTPDYQGGFLLDGGVHHAAGARMLLLLATSLADPAVQARVDSRPATVSARTTLIQEHLAPIDSVAALVTTRSGATGTYQHAAGSALSAYEFDVAYEGGWVRIVDNTVTVAASGAEPVVRTFETRSWGVSEEVAAWARGLRSGRPDPAQAPEEALADLEFVEKMFLSGEQGGKTLTYEFQ